MACYAPLLHYSVQWLKPEIEIVSRDRGGEYAAAARMGAPQARQVADRFHLAQNLTTRVEEILTKHRAEICQAAYPVESPSDLPSEQGFLADDWRPAIEPHAQQVMIARQEERQDRYRQLQELHNLVGLDPILEGTQTWKLGRGGSSKERYLLYVPIIP